MSDTKFYFARINFKHQLRGIQDFKDSTEFDKISRARELLFSYVSSDNPVYEQRDAIWRFGRCEIEDGVIYGKFGKVFTDQTMQYDDTVGDFVESDEEDEMADVSHFIIYPKDSVIAFNRKKRIGHNQFTKAFSAGYNNFHGIQDALMVTLLKSSVEIEELLTRADRVFNLDFNLVPTNPIRDENMRILDEPMRQMGADELGFSAETDDDLDTDNEFIRSGFALSNNGYGNFEMEYEEDGESKVHYSKDTPAKYEISEPDNIGGLMSISNEIYQQVGELTISQEDSE